MPILPRTIDNTYDGQKVALWLFGALLLMRLAMSINTILNGRALLQSADGIPLDTFPPSATQTILALAALAALSRLTTTLLSVVALIRYRSMVPLLFLLLLVEHVSGRVIVRVLPIARVGAPPASMIHLILLALMLAGLALSLWKRR